MSVRGLLGETWRLLRAHSLRVLAVCGPVLIAINLASAWFNPELGKSPNEGVSFAVDFFSLALYPWLAGVAVATMQASRVGGARTSAMSLYATALRRLPALIFAGLASTFGITLGLLLLVVPGLLLGARWILAVPLVMLERRSGRQALVQSNERTRGSTWALAGAFGVVTLPIFLLLGPFSYVSITEASFPAYLIGGALVGLASLPLYAALSLVAYDYASDHGDRADVA